MIGKTLGHYQIEELLGRGGMGEVYRAVDTELGRAVAIKVLPEPLAADPERLKRLRREARALASVHDPRIATLFSFEQADGHHFLVMELVEGVDLAQRISQGPLPAAESLTIVRDIAAGLSKAHDKGIVHRDLKPANIRFDAEGNLKILDFGIAHLSEETQITVPGTSLGTPSYMSPEQIRGEPVDPRSDVFSLGVMLYELIAGTRPFTGPTHAAIFESIAQTQPPSLRQAAPNAPAAADTVVRRALQKNPADRYQDVADMARDLGPDPALMVSSPWLTGRSFSWKPLLAVLTLVLVVVAGLALVRFWPATTPPPSAERSLVVLPFENLSEEGSLDWLERGVPELLTASLTQAGGLTVVSAQRIGRLLEGDAKLGDARAMEVAQKVGATSMVDGSIVRSGNVLRIQSNIVDARRGTVQASVSAEGTTDEDIFSLVADLTSSIRSYFEIQAVEEHLDEQWTRGLMTNSVDALRNFARGRSASMRSQFPAAAGFFQQAVAADSNFVAGWVGLATASWNSDDQATMTTALAQAYRLRERTSTRERAYLDLMSSVMRNEPVMIISAAGELSALEPEEPYWQYLLGRGYYKNGQFEQAIATWRALAPDFDWVWTHVYLADCYRELGQLNRARESMDTAWRMADEAGPDFQRSALFRFQARIKFAEGDFGGANADLQTAFDLYPGYPEAHYDRGVMLQERGDREAARGQFRAYLENQTANLYLQDAQRRLKELDADPR